MNEAPRLLAEALDETFAVFERSLKEHAPALTSREVGTVIYIGEGIARVVGLQNVQSEELVRFQGNNLGMVFNLDPGTVGVIMLDGSEGIPAGSEVRRTGRVMDVPVGEAQLGRIVDPTGRPLDNEGAIRAKELRSIERPAPPIMDREPVTVPLETGIKAVDALIPIGRGQRELIVGDRQTGKTSLALDTIINQKDKDVISVYCAIGQRSSAVARVVADLRKAHTLQNCIVVVATGQDPPGLKFLTPYAATTMAEYFMEQGRDVLIVYDDLTLHARAYRELSLLLRRPPGREAYPGDIFYIHSRLLERATHLRKERGGGSLTALPIIETQAQNIAAYIPTNLISITDGQIYLSPELFSKGVMPAVDIGKSVSRVGGKTQLPAYREVAGDLRLSYSQFEELEAFARFGARLDEATLKTLERGRRVREVLKQVQYEVMPAPEQIGVLLAVTEGILDEVPVEKIATAEEEICKAVRDKLPDVARRILEASALSDDDKTALLDAARNALNKILKEVKKSSELEGKASRNQGNADARVAEKKD